MPLVNNDPLLDQLVEVTTVDSGGFLVKQLGPAQVIETYCVNMDTVANLLNQIFTPPVDPG